MAQRRRLLTSGLRPAARSYCLSAASFRLACLHRGRNKGETEDMRLMGMCSFMCSKKKRSSFAQFSYISHFLMCTLKLTFFYLQLNYKSSDLFTSGMSEISEM